MDKDGDAYKNSNSMVALITQRRKLKSKIADYYRFFLSVLSVIQCSPKWGLRLGSTETHLQSLMEKKKTIRHKFGQSNSWTFEQVRSTQLVLKWHFLWNQSSPLPAFLSCHMGRHKAHSHINVVHLCLSLAQPANKLWVNCANVVLMNNFREGITCSACYSANSR